MIQQTSGNMQIPEVKTFFVSLYLKICYMKSFVTHEPDQSCGSLWIPEVKTWLFFALYLKIHIIQSFVTREYDHFQGNLWISEVKTVFFFWPSPHILQIWVTKFHTFDFLNKFGLLSKKVENHWYILYFRSS